MAFVTDVNDSADVSDFELLDRVRAGDVDAYAELYARHRGLAHGVARAIMRGAEADDIMAEAFARILTQIRNGGGPTDDFRAYLVACVRNLARRQAQLSSQTRLASDEQWLLDGAAEGPETLVAEFGGDKATRAFSSLPESWRKVLWGLEVEGRKPAELAGDLKIAPSAVSALAYRAREGLKQAYLSEHVPAVRQAACTTVRQRLSQYVRGELTSRRAAQVSAHLRGCVACSAVYEELDDVNQKIRVVIWPVVLAGGAAGYQLVMPVEASSVSTGLGGTVSSGVTSVPLGVIKAAVAGAGVVAAGVAVVGGAWWWVASGDESSIGGTARSAITGLGPHLSAESGTVSGLADIAPEEPEVVVASLPINIIDLVEPLAEAEVAIVVEPQAVTTAVEASPASPSDENGEEAEQGEGHDFGLASVELVVLDQPGMHQLAVALSDVTQSDPDGVQVEVALTVDVEFLIEAGGVSGEGWQCLGPDRSSAVGAEAEYAFTAGSTIFCQFTFGADMTPPQLSIQMTPVSLDDALTGTVSVSSEGNTDPNSDNDTMSF